MMKFIAKMADGRTLLVIGLSHDNLDRLRKDGLKGTIKINSKETGTHPFDVVVITAAPTEADMERAFSQYIGPDTILHIDPPRVAEAGIDTGSGEESGAS